MSLGLFPALQLWGCMRPSLLPPRSGKAVVVVLVGSLKLCSTLL